MSKQNDHLPMERVMEPNLQPDMNDDPLNLSVMNFAQLLDTTLSLYRKHFRAFLGISAGYSIALLILILTFFLDDLVGRNAR